MSNAAAHAPPAEQIGHDETSQPAAGAYRKKFGLMVLASALGLALLVWSFILPVLGILYLLQIVG